MAVDLDVAINAFRDARSEITRHVTRDVTVGREVTWKKGPFKGRKGVIRDVHWEINAHGEFEVYIRVATYRLKSWHCAYQAEPGGGKFVDENTSFNRTFREMLEWFEEL